MADPGTKTTELQQRVFLLKPRGKPEPSHSIDASLRSLCLPSLRSYTQWHGSQSKVKTVITTLTQTLRTSYLSGIQQGSTGEQRQATHALPLGSLSRAAVLRPQYQVQETQLGSCSNADSCSDPAFLTSSQVTWMLPAQRTYTEEKRVFLSFLQRDKTP